MIFPSPEWFTAWIEAANNDADFRNASQGWIGAVGAIVRPDQAWSGGPLYVRLDGLQGHWDDSILGRQATVTDGALFCLSADYRIWKRVIRQDLDPIRGLIQGRLRVRGQLSAVLRWNAPFRIMTSLAGQLDTTWPDELAP